MKVINKQIIKQQQGVVLLMALIMLLLITILGVASVRMSNMDTQVSGNSMFSLMVFQGAESALGKVVSNGDISNVMEAALTKDVVTQIPISYFTPTETVNGGAELVSSAEMTFEGTINGSLYGNIPNSTSSTFQIFRTTAKTELAATAAKASHTQGLAIQAATQ